MLIRSKVKTTIEKGIIFLYEKLSSDGLWHDFETLAGKSSDWVSAYIIYSISDIWLFNGLINQDFKYDFSKRILRRQRINGGWAYNKEVPTDSDSTAWALLALTLVPQWKPSAIIKGLQYLKRHQDMSSGGFKTYDIYDGIDIYIDTADPSLIVGWSSPHVSVTASCIQAFLFSGRGIFKNSLQKGIKYLLRNNKMHRNWTCYWWKGSGYPTYQVTKLLSLTNNLSSKFYNEIVHNILSNGCENQYIKSDEAEYSSLEVESFEIANNMLTLLLFPNKISKSSIDRLAELLVKIQLSDGSWPSAPILRIPPPMVKNPEEIKSWLYDSNGTRVIIKDQVRLFTSATVINALIKYYHSIY